MLPADRCVARLLAQRARYDNLDPVSRMQALECSRQPAFIPPDRDDDADERLLCIIIPNTTPPIKPAMTDAAIFVDMTSSPGCCIQKLITW